MPRFFQHIEKGADNLGKVTRLKYIDDLSDPDMTLYYFEDGTYCNSEFIAPYDTQEPLRMKKAMIEVASPNSLWKFKKRVVQFDTEQKPMVGADGQLYYAPQPENITTDENGIPINGDHAKPGDEVWEVERAPRIPANFAQEPDDNYLLSIHPELENAVVTPQPAEKKAAPKKNRIPTVRPVQKKVQPTEDFDFDSEASDSKVVAKNEQHSDELLEHEKVLLGKYAQENADLRAENEKLRQQLKDAQTNADIYTIPDEDPFIRNMVMKSKKKTCKITLSIKFDLPPKEVYDTIKTAYEDGMAENFVSSLTARIPRQSLLDSLNQGLTKFYEGTSSSKNSENKSPEVQK